jgi:DNA polymerase elongation subunit (family B)
MLNHINLGSILFLDIETVSNTKSYEELDVNLQKFWKLKCRGILKKYDEEITEEEAAAAFTDKAGIFAEFGKIICISVGFLVKSTDKSDWTIRLKSFASSDEKKLLEAFSTVVKQYYNNPKKTFFCGHNIKEFDMPYICRRMLINGLELPHSLDIAGKKPWETAHFLDTLTLWKFGDYKHYTSLSLLAAVFGFPTPKDDIDGSEVGKVFWEENDLKRIVTYCEKDVVATIHLFMKYKRMELIPEEKITSATDFDSF